MKQISLGQLLGLAVAVCGITLAGCEAPASSAPAATPAAPDYSAELRPAYDTFIGALNSKDYSGLSSAFAENFRRIAPDFSANNREEMIEGMRQLHATYPDMKFVMNKAVFDKDIAFTQWTVTGTATKTDGSPGSVNIEGATMIRFVDGQITEEWVYYDTAQFANQLGSPEIPHAN